MSRRALVRSLGMGILGVGGLTACTGGGGRRGPRTTTTAPTAEALTEPDTPLVLGSIGASYGRSAAFEKAIGLAIGEAVIDINARYGKLFDHDVQLEARHVMESADEDLSSVIASFADAGVSAVITSIDEDALVAAIPAFVEAGIAVIDVFTSGMSVRDPAVQSSGMLARLAPNDRALAGLWAEAAWTSSGKSGPAGSLAFVSADTTQGRSLEHELDQILRPAGGTLVTRHLYPPNEFGDVDAVVQTVIDNPPALLVVNGGPEVGPFLSALYEATLDEDGRPEVDIPVQLGAAATVDYSAADLAPECLSSAGGIEPGGELGEEHVNMMLNVDPGMLSTGYAYSQQGYDAVMLAALAAMDALSVQGTDIASSLPSVLTGTEACEDYGTCRVILRDALVAGERATVSYTGRMGGIEFGADRDLRKGSLRTYSWTETNALQADGTDSFELEG